jgi:hypothetical protein
MIAARAEQLAPAIDEWRCEQSRRRRRRELAEARDSSSKQI